MGSEKQLFVNDAVDSYVTMCGNLSETIREIYTQLKGDTASLVESNWQGESADAWMNFVNTDVNDAFTKVEEYLNELAKVASDMRDAKIETEHEISNIVPN